MATKIVKSHGRILCELTVTRTSLAPVAGGSGYRYRWQVRSPSTVERIGWPDSTDGVQSSGDVVAEGSATGRANANRAAMRACKRR